MELFAFNINNQRIINPADWLGQRVVADDEQGAIVGKSTDQFKFLPSQPAS